MNVNRKKLLFIYFILIVFNFNLLRVNADTVYDVLRLTNGEWHTGYGYAYSYSSDTKGSPPIKAIGLDDGTVIKAYCTDYAKLPPYKCTTVGSIPDPDVAAAVGEAMYYGDSMKDATKNNRYSCIEIIINNVFYTFGYGKREFKTDTECKKQTVDKVNIHDAVWNKYYEIYNVIHSSITFNSSSLSFSKQSDGKYRAILGFNKNHNRNPNDQSSSDWNVYCEVVGGTYEITGNNIIVTANDDANSVSLSCRSRSQSEYRDPYYYTGCTQGDSTGQSVVSYYKVKYAYGVTEARISGDVVRTGGFTINKTNSTNDVLKDLGGTGPFFRLYNNSDCTIDNIAGYDNFSSGVKIENLDPGTYYILETQAKNGYHKPEPGDDYYCVPVTITAGGNTPVPIENKTECEYSFRSDMSMKERIELYNRISDTYGLKFNKLLNMSNITPKDACQADLVKKSYTTTCLGSTTSIKSTTSSKDSNSFNENDLSMFTEKYGSYTFCLTKFSMVNKAGKSNFGTIKSGQPIIRNYGTVAEGNLERTCYNYGDSVEPPILNYEAYITDDAKFGGISLERPSQYNSSGNINNDVYLSNNKILSEYRYKSELIEMKYTLPQMYSHNKDGRIYYGYCPVENQCKDLGYGIISQFNLEPKDYDLNFTIGLNSLNKDYKFDYDLINSSQCTYTIENELIDNKNNINLEFRSVKTGITNSFFSKTGSGTRKIGANWIGNENILKDNNDSYNKNNATEAKYSIILTPSIIEEIRLYNKTNKYDDYDFDCKDNGTVCISKYLSELKDKYGLTINTSNRTDYESIK